MSRHTCERSITIQAAEHYKRRKWLEYDLSLYDYDAKHRVLNLMWVNWPLVAESLIKHVTLTVYKTAFDLCVCVCVRLYVNRCSDPSFQSVFRCVWRRSRTGGVQFCLSKPGVSCVCRPSLGIPLWRSRLWGLQGDVLFHRKHFCSYSEIQTSPFEQEKMFCFVYYRQILTFDSLYGTTPDFCSPGSEDCSLILPTFNKKTQPETILFNIIVLLLFLTVMK